MASATVTSKGQVTIPVGVRSDLGLKTGDRVEFVFNESTGLYELVPATKRIRGIAKRACREAGARPVSR